MSTQTFVYRTRFNVPVEELFRWHQRPGALARLTPPWEPVELLHQQGGIEDGARITVRTRIGPFPMTMQVEHRDYQADCQFKDVQLKGPFASWSHLHRMEPDGPGASILEDTMEFILPAGTLGELLGRRIAANRLGRMFAYRHRLTAQDLAAHARFRDAARLHLLVSGSSGLVGSNLVPFLTTGGHQVTRLVRGSDTAAHRHENRSRIRQNSGADVSQNSPHSGECGYMMHSSTKKTGDGVIPWNPATGVFEPNPPTGIDAVVHLAGEGIANRRWTVAQKARIRNSRVQGTRQLCEALAQQPQPPRVLVCASAIGFYGDRGDELLDEDSPAGNGFLAEVCREWESAADPARQAGIRVVHLRFGVILSAAGGALAKMLLPFRMGGGGILGTGRQFMSWIDINDAVGAIHHALQTDSLSGPVNAVSPNPVTNREFTKTLGRVLARPTILPMPAFAARAAFGEMADHLLLASARVVPKQLERTGYDFRFAELEDSLRNQLGHPK